MKKLIVVLCVAAGLLGLAAFGAILYFGAVTPETYVVTDRELGDRHRSTLVELGLLGQDEPVDYFYSDAMLDIRDSFMFLTEDRLVVYSNEWEEPETIFAYEDILVLEAEFVEEWYLDSYFVVEDRSGLEVTFPVSSERGRDRDVYELIEARSPNLERPAVDGAESSDAAPGDAEPGDAERE